MRHFVIDIDYTFPPEEIQKNLPKHRDFLQNGYAKGIFLLSGPKIPSTGGIIIARATSLSEILDLFKDDPFYKLGDYTFTEFNPIWHQELLLHWVSPSDVTDT